MKQTLREMREAKGFTLQQVSERLPVSYSSGRRMVWSWEHGGSRPSIDVIPALATLYGVAIQDVLNAVTAPAPREEDAMPEIVVADSS